MDYCKTRTNSRDVPGVPHHVVTQRRSIHPLASPHVQRQGQRPSPAARKQDPHRKSQAWRTRCCKRGGSWRALALDNWQRKYRLSSDHLPPTSQASTTRRARPCSPANSGYRRCFRRRAANKAAPLKSAHWGCGTPSRPRGDTIVVSMANCAPWNNGRPSATTSSRRLSAASGATISKSLRNALTAADSKANPRRPNTPTVTHTARWCPRLSRRRPHRQVR